MASTSFKARAQNLETIDEAIRRHPFLAGLGAKHLQTLRRHAMMTQYEPGEIIFREGDPANRFYLIRAGKVALQSCRHGGEPTLIQEISPGEVLGWSWLFPPYFWHFDAQAIEQTRAVFFYGSWLREQCQDDLELGNELLSRMSSIVIERLQATRNRLLAAVAERKGPPSQPQP